MSNPRLYESQPLCPSHLFCPRCDYFTGCTSTINGHGLHRGTRTISVAWVASGDNVVTGGLLVVESPSHPQQGHGDSQATAMAVAKYGQVTLVCPLLTVAAGSTGVLRGRAGRGMGERITYTYSFILYSAVVFVDEVLRSTPAACTAAIGR